METNTYGNLIRESRSKVLLSVEEVASAVGLSKSAYYDLEAGHDLTNAISLKTFYNLCNLLKLKPHVLFPTPPALEIKPVGFIELKDNVTDLLLLQKKSNFEFEKEIGWDLLGFNLDAEKAFLWNIACMRDVCAKINVDWRDVWPENEEFNTGEMPKR